MDIARIPEHALRQIWKHQRFSTTHLHTSDDRPVRILSPGRLNTDGGPDFLDASLRIGSTLYCGDVELHCDAASWLDHRHHRDPHYNRVILHVVLTDEDPSPPARTASRRIIPLLILRPFIDPELDAALVQMLLGESVDRPVPLRCRQHNDSVAAETILRSLMRLGDERLELKVRRFHERLRQLADESPSIAREASPQYHDNPDDIPLPSRTPHRSEFADRRLWEQLFYEGIMECLGYEKNRQPFLALARFVPLEMLRALKLHDVQSTMALLFGEGGLLPSTRNIHDRESRAYVRSLKHRWRELRPQSRTPKVHEGEWLFFRLRPANFPTARLAAFCFLLPSLFNDDAFRTLIGVFKDETLAACDRVRQLLALFDFEPDSFWLRHVHFRGAARRTGIALGTARVIDIIVNCILPIVLLYARVFGEHSIRARACTLFTEHLPLQCNSITRVMHRQLFKGRVQIHTAQLHQGALQLYRHLCTQGRCRECSIGNESALPTSSAVSSSQRETGRC